MVSTGYVLPFRVVYSDGVLSSGFPSYIHVRFADSLGVDAVVDAVETFALLAASGALCGASIDPALSTFKLRRHAPTSPNELRWSIEQPLICDEALVVLAHLLYAAHATAQIDLAEVVHRSTNQEPLLLANDKQLASTYPPLCNALPFAIDVAEPEGGTCSFEVELAEPLETRHADWLNGMLETWARVVTLGGYAMAPVPPEEGYVEPDELITTYERTIEWSLFKLRADEASIDAIVNGFAAFAVRCQGIDRLTIR